MGAKYPKGSGGQPDSAVLWLKVYQSQRRICPSEGSASGAQVPAILRYKTRSGIAGMEFSLSLPLQDNVKSGCISNSHQQWRRVVCSTSLSTLDVLTRFQF